MSSHKIHYNYKIAYYLRINIFLYIKTSSGKCVCEDGFGGAACDIDLRVPPQVIDSPSNRICDLKSKRCPNTIEINGFNFLNSVNLTCHIKTITVRDVYTF